MSLRFIMNLFSRDLFAGALPIAPLRHIEINTALALTYRSIAARAPSHEQPIRTRPTSEALIHQPRNATYDF